MKLWKDRCYTMQYELFSTQNLKYMHVILKDLGNAVFSVSLATPKWQIKLKSHNNHLKKYT